MGNYAIPALAHKEHQNPVNNAFTLGDVAVDAVVEIRQKTECGSPRQQIVHERLPSKLGVRVVPIKIFEGQARDVLWDTERSFKVACYRGT